MIASLRKNCKCSEELLMEVEKSPSGAQQSASFLHQGPKQLSTTTTRKSSNLSSEPFQRSSRMLSQSPAIPSTSSASAAVVQQSSSSSKSSQKMGKSSTKQIEWLHVDEQLSAKIRRPPVGKKKEKPNSKAIVSNVRVTGPKKRPNIKKSTIHVRNDYEKGSVSHFPGGYHIIWKGSIRGSDDLLHDPNGYVDSRMKLAAYRLPSDHGAYWRCNAKTPKGSICGFMLLEKDGSNVTYSGRAADIYSIFFFSTNSK